MICFDPRSQIIMEPSLFAFFIDRLNSPDIAIVTSAFRIIKDVKKSCSHLRTLAHIPFPMFRHKRIELHIKAMLIQFP